MCTLCQFRVGLEANDDSSATWIYSLQVNHGGRARYARPLAAVQRAYRAGRRGFPACLQDGTRRHRVETQGLTLPNPACAAVTREAEEDWGMCGRRRLGKNFLSCCSIGRVRSCVRPVLCGGEAAGHNALRGSGPNQKHAFKDALTQTGSPDPRIDLVCITSSCPRQFLQTSNAVVVSWP